MSFYFIYLVEPFISHFGYKQAIDECFNINAKRSFLTDFAHMLEHKTMENDLKKLESETNVYIRPAYDGMRLLRRPVSDPSIDSNEIEFDWIEESNISSMM
jgi:hypothetical protein